MILHIVTVMAVACAAQATQFVERQATDAEGRRYSFVEGDPAHFRTYVLANGLTVNLARQENAPAAVYALLVKCGSVCDPAEHTGLTHYLEHLLFNGTTQIGGLNWEKEKPLLDQLDSLYDQLPLAGSAEQRSMVFAQIDRVSHAASRFAVKGEYRKLVSQLGGEGINAVTNNETLIFGSVLPVASLPKFLVLEKERFLQPAFRAFSAELEIVCDEYNQVTNNAFFRKYVAANRALFPNHPYGTRTNIGEESDLRNPSIRAAKEHFRKYFVPGNMVVAMAGNIDYDSAIAWVDSTLGTLPVGVVPASCLPEAPLDDLTAPTQVRLAGAKQASIMVAYRMGGENSEDAKCLTLLNGMLQNRTAGLLKTAYVGSRVVQRPVSYGFFVRKQYSAHYLEAYVPQGVSPEETRDSLMVALDRIKNGDFETWRIEAAAVEVKKELISDLLNNLETRCLEAYSHGRSWKQQLDFIESLRSVTKDDIVRFANRIYKKHYVYVLDLPSEDSAQATPFALPLTPIMLNDDSVSAFAAAFKAGRMMSEQPRIPNNFTGIRIDSSAAGVEIVTVPSSNPYLFEVSAIFPVGTFDDSLVEVSLKYLDAAGSARYPGSKLGDELFKYGLDLRRIANPHATVFRVSGLTEHLDIGLTLLHEAISPAPVDTNAWESVTKREIALRGTKTGESQELRRWLRRRALYGESFAQARPVAQSSLQSLTALTIKGFIDRVTNFRYTLMACASEEKELLKKLKTHFAPAAAENEPPVGKRPELSPTARQVLIVQTPGNSVDVQCVARTERFTIRDMGRAMVFDAFLNLLVFKKLRESRSLAYDCYASYEMPDDSTGWCQVQMFGSTQPEKAIALMDGMTLLLRDISTDEAIFEEARKNLLEVYRSRKVLDGNIFWNFDELRKKGVHRDNGEQLCLAFEKMTFEELLNFYDTHIANRNWSYIVVGPVGNEVWADLSRFGEVRLVQPHEILNIDPSPIRDTSSGR